MATTFAAAGAVQMRQAVERKRMQESSAGELQKAIAAVFGQINFGTLPQGTMGAFGLTRQGRSPSPMNGRTQRNGLTPEKVNETNADMESSEMGTLIHHKAETSASPRLLGALNDDPTILSLKDSLGEIK